MPIAQDGDLLIYQQCFDPDCFARRPGTEHAHLISVEHDDPSSEADPEEPR